MMTANQLEQIVERTAGKALFDSNFNSVSDVESEVQLQMWNLSLAAHELALRVSQLDEAVKAARWRQHNAPRDPNGEHRLSARQLGIEGALI
jgi:hypothetical protein